MIDNYFVYKEDMEGEISFVSNFHFLKRFLWHVFLEVVFKEVWNIYRKLFFDTACTMMKFIQLCLIWYIIRFILINMRKSILTMLRFFCSWLYKPTCVPRTEGGQSWVTSRHTTSSSSNVSTKWSSPCVTTTSSTRMCWKSANLLNSVTCL